MSNAPESSLRVLIVEDNADAAESLAVWLELDGHEVRVALTGADAHRHAVAFSPEVVVLDLGLPDIDGYALGATLRHLPETRTARLLAVSGYGPDPDRAAAAGFAAHLVKPVDPGSVADLLRGFALGG
jgi:two-component system CheB/CheR fusion protein